MVPLSRGQKARLADLCPPRLAVAVYLTAPAGTVFDVSCFGLDGAGKLSDERYLVFYNQPASPCGGVELVNVTGAAQAFALDLDRLPAAVERLAFTVTLDGSGTMAALAGGRIVLRDGTEERAAYALTGADFSGEKAIIALEIYRRDGWRVAAVGQGFQGGLSDLLRHFGGQEEAPAAAAPPPPPPPRVNLSKIDLRKQAVGVVLAKKALTGVVARVAIVLDDSGSMRGLYKRGVVQDVVERILAVAARFDDDGRLDVWFYAEKPARTPPATERDFEGYVDRHRPGKERIGSTNNEPPALRDILKKYVEEEPDGKPAFVVFLSDGGVGNRRAIEKIIVDASRHPVFWQFVGLGKANYGVFEQLDTIEGRVVDNAGFFTVDDIATIGDAELYERLLHEFPAWLQAAKAKGIVR